MDAVSGGTAGASGVEDSAIGNYDSMAVAALSARIQHAIHALRHAVIFMTCISAFVMGFSNQQFANINLKIKSTQCSAFVYFIIANVLVCVYSAVVVGPSFINSSYSSTTLQLAIADILAVNILFTGNAAAMALDIVAWFGNSHYGWNKICNNGHIFCCNISTAIALSLMAAIVSVLIIVLSIFIMHKRSQQ